ncbi:MAG: hypothetical protein SGJ00_08865 [bacterium]|nr:hypothetical protein [bacterium]
MEEKNPHSIHTFLFPFKWEVKSTSKQGFQSLDERTPLDAFIKNMELDFWEKFKFDFKVYDGYHTYNDYNYFYSHVRDVLNLDNESDKTLVSGLQYQYSKINQESEYDIYVLGEIPLTLKIKDILLNIYEHGVGILSFHLENYTETDFNRILKINEYGRRIYPQFLGNKFPYTQDTKNNFLADKIALTNLPTPHGMLVVEDFSYYEDFSNLTDAFFVLPKFIQSLLGDKIHSNEKIANVGDILIDPVLDDRMFVLCYMVDDKLLIELKKFNEVKEEYIYQTSNKWYRFLFVDDSTASCHSKTMLKNLLTDQTYDRWLEHTGLDHITNNIFHSGQLYGVSRYSFVLLVGKSYFTQHIVINHARYIYFEMLMLCLLQRTYILNFGGEVARISKTLGKNGGDISESRLQISRLYLQYIKFVNRINFREITPQEQGIELYNLIHKTMRIQEEVNDLDKEIQELNNYVESFEEQKLSRVASWFLPISLFAGILGMNTLENSTLDNLSWADSFNSIRWILTIKLLFTSVILIWAIWLFVLQYGPRFIKNLRKIKQWK